MGLRFTVDDNIPFIKGRLEPFGEVVYCDQFGFTPENVKDSDAVIIRTRTRCDEALLGKSKVSLVATATIGMDQIDREFCAKAGITVRNSPGCNAPGVAQYVWSCLLRSGFDPTTRTLGIVGCGNVGKIVEEWGRLLGARILVNDPPRTENGDAPANDTPLDELLSCSDAVTLHTPLTRTGRHATYHLIGEREIALMKPGSILVNAARGPVTETEAVKKSLREKRISAIIDTWENEPDPDRELLSLAGTATFHIAGYSLEGKQRATRMVLEAVGEKFGINPDLSGLAPAYIHKTSLTAEEIMASYDPACDMEPLRRNPEMFDTLRRNYKFRKEV